jgi:hypothetical protein
MLRYTLLTCTSLILFCTSTVLAEEYNYGTTTVPPRYHFGETYKRRQHGDTHFENHNEYKNWRIPNSATPTIPDGASCCNNDDCDITQIFEDKSKTENKFYIIYLDKPLYLADSKRLKEPNGKFKASPDGNDHACVIEYEDGPIGVCWVLAGEQYY